MIMGECFLNVILAPIVFISFYEQNRCRNIGNIDNGDREHFHNPVLKKAYFSSFIL